LSRNPLGILALFILLVYGIAGLTVSVSSGNMQRCERLPLICFLVAFPLIVLFVFYHLVTKHHTKLYAPSDFADKDDFFRAFSTTEHKQHLDKKEAQIAADAEGAPEDGAALGDKEKKQSAPPLSPRHAYVLAEDMAFREIESEFNVPIHRHVIFPSCPELDGFFIHNRFPVIIDIRYARVPSKPRVPAIQIEKLRALKHATGLPASFLLLVVTDGLNAEQRASEEERLQEAARGAWLNVDVRIYDFDALRQKYGI